ncbi:MAG: type I restriction enzyme HsdR N-terminal domain-containing protein [Bacteroidia bacterium]|nr:type I restriction enzyme HsdR N-terminal domain-containing protein [Bacteroidia bacterium]MBT8276172.1 type I restriction enzyme HsdR N-terminal domain-containing protein [Bacteroidia bacterium]NNF31990.1 type I restriction enzyme HsdR N-terminal domain-containing protein [Flavobacteriaceae bacterium]NNK52947.1 type I restriction enzyme HsdR N-terminal domain-containing protein [Flavobacteriaceae bacterium]NNM09684.1 type I restriction enzyme HsdR N-terminal domain-containing protein [Flavo
MQPLNFPSYKFRFKNRENKPLIFDVVRKKFVVLTPEEWVRQHCVQFLHHQLNFPLSLINVEKQIKVHSTTKRYDIVVFKPDGSIHLIVECKAPKISISQETFDQVARYNFVLQASYLMVTNGLTHYYCIMDYDESRYHFLKELPPYDKK